MKKNTDNNIRSFGIFTNKQEAISEAKNYMRLNPNG